MKIKVLLFMPGREAQLIKIPANTKFLKAFIGEELYRIRLDKNTILYANKNAKVDEFNRFYKGNVLLGNFLVISIKNNYRVSMKKKDIRKYSNMFKLRKYQRRLEILKDEYLEEYYCTQRKQKEKNAKRNKEIIFKIAA
ncbi:MAG: hypothetical protein J6I85_07025 [Clostridia bacterium]|nr:hypothetical protein [Clostridia bacterium]MBP3801752.1 hypothetical protein [Clostridia bacterium]